jgi:hypothetical protein
VPIHLGPRGYDIAGVLNGTAQLNAIEETELGPVAGLHILHLQCHFGAERRSNPGHEGSPATHHERDRFVASLLAMTVRSNDSELEPQHSLIRIVSTRRSPGGISISPGLSRNSPSKSTGLAVPCHGSMHRKSAQVSALLMRVQTPS